MGFQELPLIHRLWNEFRGKCFYCNGATWIPKRKRRYSGVTLGETRVEAIIRLKIAASERATVSDLLKYSLATKEHLVRKCDGGKGFGNYAMACMYCNSKRGEATVEEHKEAMIWRVMRGDHPVNRSAAMMVRPQAKQNDPPSSTLSHRPEPESCTA